MRFENAKVKTEPLDWFPHSARGNYSTLVNFQNLICQIQNIDIDIDIDKTLTLTSSFSTFHTDFHVSHLGTCIIRFTNVNVKGGEFGNWIDYKFRSTW